MIEDFFTFGAFEYRFCDFLFDAERLGCFILGASLIRQICERAMIWTAYHSTEISNRQSEIFSQKHIFYTFVGGTFSLDISICFGSKIRKIGIPLHTPVLLYKSGV